MNEKEIKGWRCCSCGRPLPKKGYVWFHRWRSWKDSGNKESGYYCDPCADARESGMDY